MKIEQELKITKPMHEKDKVFINLMFTGNWINNINNKFFEEFDLTSQQYNVLRILRGSLPDPMSSTSIQERMLDRNSNITRLMDKLSKKGLAVSDRCPENKRKVDIKITEAGLNLLKEIDNRLKERDCMLSDDFTNEDAAELNRLLDKIRK